MFKYNTKKILPHNLNFLFDIVLDVARYPEFLPWLTDARVYGMRAGQDGGSFMGDLHIGYGLACVSYTSSIIYHKSDSINDEHPSIKVEHIKGPFHHLSNLWMFEFIDDASTCVHFDVCFELDSFVLKKMLDPVLKNAAPYIMEAFEKRAYALSHADAL